MRRRTLGNGAIIGASLLTLTGLGMAIANAATDNNGGGSQCAEVFRTTEPAGEPAGKLCTTVDADAGITVALTASSSCGGSVMLRASGIDSSGAEFGKVEKVTCGSNGATASFTPASAIAPDTFVCGTLLADKYTAAQACVAIS